MSILPDRTPIHDELAWQNPWSTRRTDDETWCGCSKLVLVNRADGHTLAPPYRCKSWTCRNCADRRVGELLAAAEERFAEARRVWCSMHRGPWTEVECARLRQRRQTADAKYLWVRREEGPEVWVFATKDLGGKIEPRCGYLLGWEQALELLLSALRLPGVAACHWSAGWQPAATPTRFWSLGVHPEDLYREALEAAGARCDGWSGEGPPPAGVTPAKWRRILEEELNRAEAEHRGDPESE
jgi:hypothetical protein